MSETGDLNSDHPKADPAAKDRARSASRDTLPANWRQVFEESLPGLRAFLRRRLAQDSDVDDCLQLVSIQMIEKGGDVAPAARRAWLFRVAANESAQIWRKKASTEKMLQRYPAQESLVRDPSEGFILSETTEQLSEALADLPPGWQQVVRLRIHENLTFQQIADQLDIPLGTALTQMRRALERLRKALDPEQS